MESEKNENEHLMQSSNFTESDSASKLAQQDLKDEILTDNQESVDIRDVTHESVWTLLIQSLFPLFISGAGLIGNGLLLNLWQNGEFYSQIHEAFILTPALLGLKGNIEMTFVSRLATAAHQGKFDKTGSRLSIIWANMALIQIQAIVVSFFASGISVITSTVGCGFHFADSLMMTVSAIIASSVSSVLLGFSMIGLVLFSRKFRINPDNIMAPIAASFGDLITFLFFVGIGTALIFGCQKSTCWIAVGILIFYISSIPLWIWIANNDHTRETLIWGWISIGIAVVLSSIGGFILEQAVFKFQYLALFQPLLCGLAGNRVAVQCSRLSTCFHTGGRAPGEVLPMDTFLHRLNPWNTFNCKDIHSKSAMVLITLALPSHFLFMLIIFWINGKLNFHWELVLSYLFAAFIQIIFLMYICQLLVYTLWRLKIDPDHAAIPILTSISDVLGIGLLMIVFLFLENTSPSSVGVFDKGTNEVGVCL